MAPLPRPLIVTSGEPAGIGPDICLALAERPFDRGVVVAGDRAVLAERAQILGQRVNIVDYSPQLNFPLPAHTLAVLHAAAAAPVRPGRLDPANSRYVLGLLTRAADGCRAGEFGGMVTAPVHKGVINDAGIAFTGHTEFLAEYLDAPQVVMMLVGGGMRVALVTTHLPLRDVPDAITRELLERILRTIQRDFATRLGIPRPRILVAGLNPHAGEDGHLGREEIEVMIPVLDRLRAEGMYLSPPLPADTLFAKHRLAACDCVLAMYHDQGLPVLKHASFGEGVNVTLGLPVIRASVDHGTALDLAGSGRADAGSLGEAIALAALMADNEAHG
jgi:4-hydroxythreonine-4-phosphate dehydrogenase